MQSLSRGLLEREVSPEHISVRSIQSEVYLALASLEIQLARAYEFVELKGLKNQPV